MFMFPNIIFIVLIKWKKTEGKAVRIVLKVFFGLFYMLFVIAVSIIFLLFFPFSFTLGLVIILDIAFIGILIYYYSTF